MSEGQGAANDPAAGAPRSESRVDSEGLPRRRSNGTREPAAATDEVSPGDGYRIVTDLVTGPNLRWRDNLFQAAFMFVTLVLAVGVGGLFWGVEGAVIGAAGGLIGGLLLSGAALGVYRAVRHSQGRHK